MVAAYNSSSVEARNILSSTPREDILTESMPCIARVEVASAFFEPSYNGPKGVPAPVMKMIGQVGSFFIEDDDDRVFPCNDKEIQMMSPEMVIIEYALSPEEIASMALKGMFHDPDFQPPSNLTGNMIEIPMNITYRGIYDTPCCFIEIISPMELTTSTKDNNYYGMFEACAVSPVIAEMEQGRYDFSYFNQPRREPAPSFEEYQPEPIEQEQVPQLSDEEIEDEGIQRLMEERIGQASQDFDRRRDQVDRQKIAQEVLYPAREEAIRLKEEEEEKADNSYKMLHMDDGGKDNTIKRDPLRNVSSIYGILRQKAADAPGSAQVDTPLDQFGDDERQYGEGYGNEQQDQQQEDAGFVDFGEGIVVEEGEDFESTKSKAEAKKSREAARRVDIANDNKLMNMGIDDVAGFTSDAPSGGSGGKRELNMSQKLLLEVQAKRKAAEEQRAAEAAAMAAKAEAEKKPALSGPSQFL